MTATKRPALRYHGGKWRIAPWIIEHMSPHRTYVEPYTGAAPMLLKKEIGHAKVIDSLDGRAAGLCRVLRDRPASAELLRRILLLPPEWKGVTGDKIEDARRYLLQSWASFGFGGPKTLFYLDSPVPGVKATKSRRWIIVAWW